MSASGDWKSSENPQVDVEDQIVVPRPQKKLPSLKQLAGLDMDMFDTLEVYLQQQRSN